MAYKILAQGQIKPGQYQFTIMDGNEKIYIGAAPTTLQFLEQARTFWTFVQRGNENAAP
jgi:hypothetical protein